MPTRTITISLCDICLEQNGTETEASQTFRFSLEDIPYTLITCEEHAAPIQTTFGELAAAATKDERSSGSTRQRGGTSKATLFSQLDSEEKDRFRKWADMPTARRIGDARVNQWIDAGRP